MKPAFSVISFTAVAGAAQGLVVALAVSALTDVPLSARFTASALLLALVMLGLGLAASFLHLGRPERAWRAMAMWRTSWLSREVIVLPAFMAVVALWWALLHWGAGAGGIAGGIAGESAGLSASGSASGIGVGGPATAARLTVTLILPVLALAGAALLWWCTGQIYACLRFIQEWAHPLTLLNFALIGLSSGLLLGCALAAAMGERSALAEWAPRALAATLAAWGTRTLALRRNAWLKPKSTAQSATGLHAARLVQKSMGMSAGAFNTREFFHGATQMAIAQVHRALHLLGFALPAALMAAALWVDAAGQGAGLVTALWWAAVVSQVPGVGAERWLFFAQARHPQNLYYQAVS